MADLAKLYVEYQKAHANIGAAQKEALSARNAMISAFLSKLTDEEREIVRIIVRTGGMTI